MPDDPLATPPTLDVDPDGEPTRRERLSVIVERRLDVPMAVLALAWAALVAYELVAPAAQRGELRALGNVLWAIFVLEFLAKLVISGHPLRFLRRRWPSVLFLALPALRTLRVIRALRALRVLPVARVVGSSYRAIGTARTLLSGRLAFLAATTAAVVFGGAQLLFLVEAGGRVDGSQSLGEALWWSANLVISGSYLFEPQTLPGRGVALLLSGYAVVVFASLAAALGAFFIEQRAEQEEAAVNNDIEPRRG
ncbi:MAG TPA: ion transporter [Acidimicrobiales bacterium]|nr:ion transporter [Acidimicrobiales bacterium]